jgi:chromosome segregation ATPase
MSGGSAADNGHSLARFEGEAYATNGAAAQQPNRRLVPVGRRTLKRRLAGLQTELVSYERQVGRVLADLQEARAQLLERKYKLEQTEQARAQEASQRAAAEVNLHACAEALTAARNESAQLQLELAACDRQRLALESGLQEAHARINQLERERPGFQTRLPQTNGSGEKDGLTDEARPERVRDARQQAIDEQGHEAREAAGAERQSPTDRPAIQPRMIPLRAAVRWRVEQAQANQTLHASYGDRLQLSLSGEGAVELMQRLQSAAPQLQLLAEALYPSPVQGTL